MENLKIIDDIYFCDCKTSKAAKKCNKSNVMQLVKYNQKAKDIASTPLL